MLLCINKKYVWNSCSKHINFLMATRRLEKKEKNFHNLFLFLSELPDSPIYFLPYFLFSKDIQMTYFSCFLHELCIVLFYVMPRANRCFQLISYYHAWALGGWTTNEGHNSGPCVRERALSKEKRRKKNAVVNYHQKHYTQ